MVESMIVVIFALTLWLVRKHYDNAYEIEVMWNELKKQKDKISNVLSLSSDDITSLKSETVNIAQSMRKMKDDIIENKQNDINIDAKYKAKLKEIDRMLEETSEDVFKLSSKAFVGRSEKEVEAFSKLAKQISGHGI